MHDMVDKCTHEVPAGIREPLGVDHTVAADAVIVPGLCIFGVVKIIANVKQDFHSSHQSSPPLHTHLHDARGDAGHGRLEGRVVTRPVVLALGTLYV